MASPASIGSTTAVRTPVQLGTTPPPRATTCSCRRHQQISVSSSSREPPRGGGGGITSRHQTKRRTFVRSGPDRVPYWARERQTFSQCPWPHTDTHTHHSLPPFTSSSTPQRRRAFDRTMLDRWEKNKITQTTSFDRPICLSFPLGNKNSHWLRYERQPAQDMRERDLGERQERLLFFPRRAQRPRHWWERVWSVLVLPPPSPLGCSASTVGLP